MIWGKKKHKLSIANIFCLNISQLNFQDCHLQAITYYLGDPRQVLKTF